VWGDKLLHFFAIMPHQSTSAEPPVISDKLFGFTSDSLTVVAADVAKTMDCT
jgi:hypothetical protein